MSGRNRRASDTIAAMLGNAPALVPTKHEAVEEVTPGLGEKVYSAEAIEVRPSHLQPAAGPAADELDDVDPEIFDFETTAPLVRPRKRKSMDYQTVRLFRSTWQPLRQAWLMNRKVDSLISFTEFASVVCQRGLQSLKAEVEREARRDLEE